MPRIFRYGRAPSARKRLAGQILTNRTDEAIGGASKGRRVFALSAGGQRSLYAAGFMRAGSRTPEEWAP